MTVYLLRRMPHELYGMADQLLGVYASAEAAQEEKARLEADENPHDEYADRYAVRAYPVL